MNVNISNEFNFSVVHGAMNRSGSRAKSEGVRVHRYCIMQLFIVN